MIALYECITCSCIKYTFIDYVRLCLLNWHITLIQKYSQIVYIILHVGLYKYDTYIACTSIGLIKPGTCLFILDPIRPRSTCTMYHVYQWLCNAVLVILRSNFFYTYFLIKLYVQLCGVLSHIASRS